MTTPIAARAKPFALNISKGIAPSPEKILAYGSAGIGKSTFAACAPKPLFLDLEGGTSQLDVARVGEIKTWDELLAAVRTIAAEDHGYETLVIDTLDRAEWLCWEHVKKASGVDSIEKVGGGYAKGYTASYEAMRTFFAALESCWRAPRKMRLIVLAHSKLETIHTPGEPDYQRFTLKAHDKVGGLFVEAVDAVLFAHFEIVISAPDRGQSKGVATGGTERYMHTVGAATHVAKNRFGLPARIPLSWDHFAQAVAEGHSPVLLRATLRGKIAKLAEARRPRVLEALTSAGDDVAKLVALGVRIDARLTAGEDPAPSPVPPVAEPTSTQETAEKEVTQ